MAEPAPEGTAQRFGHYELVTGEDPNGSWAGQIPL